MLPAGTINRGAAHRRCTSDTWTSHKRMVTLTSTMILSRPSLIRSTPLHATSSKQPELDPHVKPQQLQSQQLKPSEDEQVQPEPQQMQQPAIGRTAAATTKQERDLLIPILVAVSLALYALIAVLGLVDSLDTQQLADWQP